MFNNPLIFYIFVPSQEDSRSTGAVTGRTPSRHRCSGTQSRRFAGADPSRPEARAGFSLPRFPVHHTVTQRDKHPQTSSHLDLVVTSSELPVSLMCLWEEPVYRPNPTDTAAATVTRADHEFHQFNSLIIIQFYYEFSQLDSMWFVLFTPRFIYIY